MLASLVTLTVTSEKVVGLSLVTPASRSMSFSMSFSVPFREQEAAKQMHIPGVGNLLPLWGP